MLTSLYLHIPFCNQICTYCDFHKEIANDHKKSRYIDALLEELRYHKNKYTHLKTIYIGGGTPSSLSLDLLEKLLKSIEENIDLSNIIEYSIETNPNDITEEFSLLLKQYHVNRVSIGVQTFKKSHLTFLGRTHNEEDVNNAIHHLLNAGIENISVDMIFSLINQSIDELKSDLNKVLKLPVKHISYYSLILEEKTKLMYLYDQDKIQLNSEDSEAKMYETVINTIKDQGFDHYEISNFTKPGYKSIHNLTYWTNREYLGLGSGSHSFMDKKRFYHPTNVSKYISQIEHKEFDQYDFYTYDTITDEMILGLRLMEGISIDYIESKYNITLLDTYTDLLKYIDSGHVLVEDGYIKLTYKGIFIGNEIFQIFMEVN